MHLAPGKVMIAYWGKAQALNTGSLRDTWCSTIDYHTSASKYLLLQKTPPVFYLPQFSHPQLIADEVALLTITTVI